ncbi:hypothetical protein [Mesorhizobium captivum]|uniref:hypothetical protein n=1 Tax=Mesorhizobium captivum TaxID=3072319 RepID=UPI002A247F7C|nr:hypothetical protein [Mesorhizobium sp. VK22B]
MNPAESGDGWTEMRAEASRRLQLPPQNRLMRSQVGLVCCFFSDYGAGLLIVAALFFIQRRDGEVAEWSKALPC